MKKKTECPNCVRLLEDCNGNCIFGPDSWKQSSITDLMLAERGRTETFQRFLDSLNDKKVKRAGGEVFSSVKFEKNWSTSRR